MKNTGRSRNNGKKIYQEYLKRNASELYEWYLKLCYLSTSDTLTHVQISSVSGNLDDSELPFGLCKKHHNELLESGKFVLEKVLHNPDVHPFPHYYDDSWRSSLEALYNAEYKEFAQKQHERLINSGDNIYFPNEPEKEFAMVYLDGMMRGREESPIDNILSLRGLALEAKCLSIICSYFSEYQKITKWNDDEFIAHIDEWRDCIIGDSREMIGYWRLGDKLKRWGKKGGGVDKKPKGIRAAIRYALEDLQRRHPAIFEGVKTKSGRALGVWTLLTRETCAENNYARFDDCLLFYDPGRVVGGKKTPSLYQIENPDEPLARGKAITYGKRFIDHVDAVYREMKAPK